MALSPQEKIAKLEAQKKAIALKIQAAQRKVDEQEAKKHSENRNRIGILAEKAGIESLADAVLLEAFKSIKSSQTSVTS